jgi:hypothetical protein
VSSSNSQKSWSDVVSAKQRAVTLQIRNNVLGM